MTSRMQRALPFLMLLPLAYFASGCVYALHVASRPTAVKLGIHALRPEVYLVRVAAKEAAEYPIPSDGRVQFVVPSLQNGCDVYLFGVVRKRDASPEQVPVIELRHGERLIRRLSLKQVAKLPQDDAGYSIVRD